MAYTLPGETLDRIVAWQAQALAGVPGRIVPRESLHVTVAFLGERPVGELAAVAAAVRATAEESAVPPPTLAGGRYRETRSVGMLVLDDAEGRATLVAAAVQERLAALGVYEPERRRWLPHLTVLRFRARPGLRPADPQLEPFDLLGLALFRSVLGRGGARHEVVECHALRLQEGGRAGEP